VRTSIGVVGIGFQPRTDASRAEDVLTFAVGRANLGGRMFRIEWLMADAAHVAGGVAGGDDFLIVLEKVFETGENVVESHNVGWWRCLREGCSVDATEC
jgi:hypothetical protein